MFGQIYLYVGPSVAIGRVVNGFTDLNLYRSRDNNLIYSVVVTVVIVIVVGVILPLRSKRSQSKMLERRMAKLENRFELSIMPGALNTISIPDPSTLVSITPRKR
jgi:hypothetical protein